MAVKLGTNISSLIAQRRLVEHTTEYSKVLERLSSGMRINKASDDAAGLAIATSLNTDARIYRQAMRNVSDATSLYNIAESAIAGLSDVIIRIKELAEQSSNGVYTNNQRQAIDAEAQALREEFNRIVDATKFNGVNLLNGDLPQLSVQAGYSSILLDGTTLSTSPTGDGTFGAATNLYSTVNNTDSDLVTADYNNDGILDIINTVGANDRINVFIGNGDGTFQAPRSYYSGDRPTQIATEDLNNDGLLDLVVSSEGDNVLNVLLGNSDGSFKANVSFGSVSLNISLADLNGDGNIDLVGASFVGDSVHVRFGNGDGSLKAAVTYASGNGTAELSLGDVNGDSILDVVSVSFLDGRFNVMLGNSNGTFSARTSYALAANSAAVRLYDLNGDDVLDAIAVTSSGAAQVLLGNSNGTFNAAVQYTGISDGVTAADVDGDGILDIVGVDGGTNTIAVLIGNGDGTFQAAYSYTAGSSPFNLIIADFNQDFALDIATTSFGSGGVDILLGNLQISPYLSSFSLLSQDEALSALSFLMAVYDNVTESRGNIGAQISRLDVIYQNVSSIASEYSTAASRILDADIAEETANLVRQQILQQAATSIIAQANQSSYLVLRLLDEDK